MGTLYQLGFEKAVILRTTQHRDNLIEIGYTEALGHLQEDVTPVRTAKPWPPPQPTWTIRPMYSSHVLSNTSNAEPGLWS